MDIAKIPYICLDILTYILNQTQTKYLKRPDIQAQPKVRANIYIFIKITLLNPYKIKALLSTLKIHDNVVRENS